MCQNFVFRIFLKCASKNLSTVEREKKNPFWNSNIGLCEEKLREIDLLK